MIGLTKSAALEYAPRGIRINRDRPGTIETPMVTEMIAQGGLGMDEAIANQPTARLGQATEMAAAALWLCSPGASFVVGIALPVDGGYTRTLRTELPPPLRDPLSGCSATSLHSSRSPLCATGWQSLSAQDRCGRR